MDQARLRLLATVARVCTAILKKKSRTHRRGSQWCNTGLRPSAPSRNESAIACCCSYSYDGSNPIQENFVVLGFNSTQSVSWQITSMKVTLE